MSAEQEVTHRASSLSCSGTPCSCRAHETGDKQLGTEWNALLQHICEVLLTSSGILLSAAFL